MRYLSLFSGIEAASVAWHPLGWECVGVAEVELFPCRVLAHHFPNVPNLGDITKITREQIEALGHIDLIVGGFPCQDLSIAGKRKGLRNEDGSATRSGLFYTAMRIVEWADPRWVLLENVPGMFSSNAGADFASVVGELAGCGFDVPKNKWRNTGVVAGPRGLVEWVTLDAQYVRTQTHARAVPQRRRRVFLVRDSGDWTSRPPLFLEPESLRGNPPPRRKARQDVTHDASQRTYECGGIGRYRHSDVSSPILQSGADLGPGCEALVSAVGGSVAHTLSSEGFDASEDGTGRGTPIVAFSAGNSANSRGIGLSAELSPPHEAAGSGTNMTPTVAYGIRTANTSSNGWGIQEEVTHTLDRAKGFAVTTPTMQVRRLTPLECERLQGFPDNWTNIPGASDTVRYKALGNSMATNVMNYLGQKINDSH